MRHRLNIVVSVVSLRCEAADWICFTITFCASIDYLVPLSSAGFPQYLTESLES